MNQPSLFEIALVMLALFGYNEIKKAAKPEHPKYWYMEHEGPKVIVVQDPMVKFD